MIYNTILVYFDNGKMNSLSFIGVGNCKKNTQTKP